MAGLKTVKDVWNKTNGVCYICEKPISHIRFMTVDHVMPLSKGGSNRVENMMPAHKKCNNDKADKVDDVYLNKLIK